MLTDLLLSEITDDDLRRVFSAMGDDDPENLKKHLLGGKARMLRWENKGIASIVVSPDEKTKTLFIWYMGGRDLWKESEKLVEALSEYGKNMGLERLQAQVFPRLAQLYIDRLDFKTKWMIVEKEI